ncbi:MAG: hypothetical protein WD967_01240 [Candidatus Levyibacteriota bacterium]
MQYILIFLIELSVLFFLSRSLIKTLSQALLVITKSRKLTVTIIALLFFPGVVIHELAHLLTAGILFVPVGDIELTPQIRENGEVRLGSVSIAKTDLIRRMIIGLAPVIFGLALILGIPYLFLGNLSLIFTSLVVYIMFVVGNTMFSSSKDLEGVVEFLIVILIVLLAFYFMEFKAPFQIVQELLSSEKISSFFRNINVLLLWTIGIDILGFLGSKLLLRIARRG